MRIRVVWEGRTKNAALRTLEEDFAARVRHFADLVIEELPAARARRATNPGKLSSSERRLLERLQGSTTVMLDPGGREWTSPQFAAWLGRQAVGGAREIAFLIGGPEGFSDAWREQADVLLALSRMTVTHEWARALLLEQLYRCFAILRGFPYAR